MEDAKTNLDEAKKKLDNANSFNYGERWLDYIIAESDYNEAKNAEIADRVSM